MILVAPTSFKGTIGAAEAAATMAAALRRALPGEDVLALPLSDGGPGLLEALAAGKLSAGHGRALVNAADPEGLARTVETETRRRMSELFDDGAKTIEAVVTAGSAPREILKRAADETADLIVMGVHGRGAVDLRLFGSTTHQVIRGAACPVLIVPG